jgi:hypothetical protein
MENTPSILQPLLDAAGVAPSPRYSVKDVATVLDRTTKQVLDLIKKNRLPAVKVSARQWGFVLHEDLVNYLLRLNGRRH